jgi:hypothetical protein
MRLSVSPAGAPRCAVSRATNTDVLNMSLNVTDDGDFGTGD